MQKLLSTLRTYPKNAILALFILLFSSPAWSAQHYLDPVNGNDAWDGLAPSYTSALNGPWQSCGKAKTAGLKPGEDLAILAGTTASPCSLEINWNGTASDRVVITSYNKGQANLAMPILDGKFAVDKVIHGIEVNYITIQGLHLKNALKDLIAVEAYHGTAHDWTVTNNILENAREAGITTLSWFDPLKFSHLDFSANTISGIGGNPAAVCSGILAWGAAHVRIHGNTIAMAGECYEYSGGIRIGNGSLTDTGSEISFNRLSGQIEGDFQFNILVDGTHYVDIFNNTLRMDQTHGIWLDELTPGERNSGSYCKIYNNTVASRFGRELLHLEAGANDNLVFNNTFDGAVSNETTWFTVSVNNGSSRNRIYNNTLTCGSRNMCLAIGFPEDKSESNDNRIMKNVFQRIGPSDNQMVYIGGPGHSGHGNWLDHNIYNKEYTSMFTLYNTCYHTLREWSISTGNDAHSTIRSLRRAQ